MTFDSYRERVRMRIIIVLIWNKITKVTIGLTQKARGGKVQKYLKLYTLFFASQFLVHIVFKQNSNDLGLLDMALISFFMISFWWLFDYIFKPGPKKK